MTKTFTYEEKTEEINLFQTPEEKIVIAIAFMRETISCEGKPRFRDFWRMKKKCFEYLSLETNPIKKTFFWKEYSELLKEAHKLQEMFKEEIEFHEEQIKLAISGLEFEIHNTERAEVIQLSGFERFPVLKKMEQRARFFENLKEKVIALREEVLVLEIRVHQKNNLLEVLKKIGDKVFPEYKKIVQNLTASFEEEVAQFFIKLQNATDKSFLKRDIRGFQAILKEIHISHESYKRFREKFSGAWKGIEELEVVRIENKPPLEEKSKFARTLSDLLDESAMRITR